MCFDRLSVCRVLNPVLFFLAFLVAPAFTYASPYRLSRGRELIYLGGGGLVNLAGIIAANSTGSITIADLQRLDKKDIPSFDRPYAGRWDPDIDKMSDMFLGSCLLLPVTLVLSQPDDAKTLGLLYAETLLLAEGGATLSKATVRRYRPFAYGNTSPLADRLERAARQSFFSGHATGIACSLVFTAKVYSDYHPTSRYRPYIWSAAIIGAISGSWLRVEAGRHFPSDVAEGLIWGGFVGYAIPARHHKTHGDVSVIPFVHEGQRGAMIVKEF